MRTVLHMKLEINADTCFEFSLCLLPWNECLEISLINISQNVRQTDTIVCNTILQVTSKLERTCNYELVLVHQILIEALRN